jgi:hypothetical protein
MKRLCLIDTRTVGGSLTFLAYPAARNILARLVCRRVAERVDQQAHCF